ncbi:MAG: flavin reductase family protein [Pseudomonadota bacterium]
MAECELFRLRQALGSFATGVTVVTTSTNGKPVGVTISSFSSVSLTPPMVLWTLRKSSSSMSIFAQEAHFAVHILSQDQLTLCERFSTSHTERFSGLNYSISQYGTPRFPDCAGRFECRTVHQYDGGDHIIFVGEVMSFDTNSEVRPLLFHNGKLKTLMAS